MPDQDLQRRLIAPCGHATTESGNDITLKLEASAFFRRLLLFDTYVLQTVRFKEFIPLVRSIGVDKTVILLQSGALEIEADPSQIFNSGQTEGFPGIRTKPPLPLGSFAFSRFVAADHRDYISRCLADLQKELAELSLKQAIKLKRALVGALLPVPEHSARAALENTVADLRANTPVARTALALKLKKERGIDIAEDRIALRVIPIDQTDFATECDLESVGLRDRLEIHKLLESALLAVGGVNMRLEEMKEYNALSGAIDDELPILHGKFNFLTSALSPGGKEIQIERILKACDLPSFDLRPPDLSFDIDLFLEIRSSKECAEFREWLRLADKLTERQLQDRVASLAARIGSFLQSPKGKLWRFLISAGVGAIPLVGALGGPVLGAIDSFVVEKIFPTSGALFFLHRLYPSLFENRKQQAPGS